MSMPRSSIMVVDDHPAMRLALRQVFSRTGEFNVVAEAGTAEQALQLSETVAPKLAIVDLRLPDLDGIELILSMRKARPEMRILVFSSADERIHASHAREAGAHGFVSKAREPDELVDSARLVLSDFTCFATDTQKKRGAVLSERETAVLRMLIGGTSNVDVATALGISPKTVSTYKTRLLRKLALRTVIDLVEWAKSNGIRH